jgi:hypothetical protein
VRRLVVAAFGLAACIGPNLLSTRDDEGGRGGIVSFHGRENIGYVDARVMQDRTDEALDMARTWCDGGVEVTDKHSEGGENFIDFKCSVAVAAAPAPKPCTEAAPPAADAAPPAPAQPVVAPDTSQDTPPSEPPPPVKKKKKRPSY